MRIEIYGRPNCAYCNAAVSLCKQKKLEYKYYEVDKDFTVEELFEKVPFKTYPQIFINDATIGGYNEFLQVML
jgi:glutaredoxin